MNANKLLFLIVLFASGLYAQWVNYPVAGNAADA